MRPGLVVAVALAAAMAVAGSAAAQSVATIVVTPAMADPGGAVVVTSGASSPCPPPTGTTNPSVSVDLYAVGSATPTNRVPYLGVVTATGTWSVEVRLAPDLAPGPYRVVAGCYTGSGLNAGFGPIYEAGRLDLRQQTLGPPTPSVNRGQPGDTLQVVSDQQPCVPPTGAPSPRVRVSLLDAEGATRAEAEGPINARSGQWSVVLTVPSVDAVVAAISAVCLARVGASVPYARYDGALFSIEAVTPAPTSTVPSVPGTTTTVAPGTQPGPTTSTTLNPVTVPLPATPRAVPVVAEPTYTG